MSYILDALKRSENERKRGTVPNLLTVQDSIPHEPRKRSLWPFIIFIALLLNAVVLVLWFGPWHAKNQDAKTQEFFSSELSKSDIPLIGVAKKNEEHKSKPAVEKITTQTIQDKADLQKKVSDTPKPTAYTKKSQAISSVVPQQTAGIPHIPSEQKQDNNSLAPIQNKIYNLSELPLSIQQNLPNFAISVFLYSDDPASRMVKINGQTMKESEYLNADLKLEEIIPNGIILRYQNYRFRVNLK